VNITEDGLIKVKTCLLQKHASIVQAKYLACSFTALLPQNLTERQDVMSS